MARERCWLHEDQAAKAERALRCRSDTTAVVMDRIVIVTANSLLNARRCARPTVEKLCSTFLIVAAACKHARAFVPHIAMACLRRAQTSAAMALCKA